MAFPTVQGTPAETAVSTASTSHVINLPASIQAGELLLIVLSKGTPASTASFNALAGWTELVDEAVSLGITIWARQATGSEGATVTMTSTVAVRSASIAYRISGAIPLATQAPQLSTVATGSSTTPNATTCTPTGGAKDYLWISMFGRSGEQPDDDTWVSSAPTTPSAFSNLRQKACGVAGTNLAGLVATAQLAANAASLDAGAFTAVTGAWRAYTIAIHPAPIYSGTASLTLGNLELTGTGTVTLPTVIGSGTLMLGGLEVVGSAGFTAPVYSGSAAALTLGGMELIGGAAFTTPVYSGTAALTLGGIELLGAAQSAPPTSTATATLTLGGIEIIGAGTYGATATVRIELFGDGFLGFSAVQSNVGLAFLMGDPLLNYSLAAGVIGGFGELVLPGLQLTGSGSSLTEPSFTATGTLVLGGLEIAGVGHNPPAAIGVAALTLGGIELAGAATFVAPVFTAAGSLTLGGLEITGDAPVMFIAAGSITLPGLVITGGNIPRIACVHSDDDPVYDVELWTKPVYIVHLAAQSVTDVLVNSEAC